MAKRKPTQTIPPFPAEIDRAYFAAWLSGFTDGEGCFLLRYDSKKKIGFYRGIAIFTITIRLDDLPALQLVQSYLQCGLMHIRQRKNRENPVAVLRIEKPQDLIRHVVPHFDRHPLLAKKARDYAIWKEGLTLLHRVRHRKRRTRGYNLGTRSKWAPEEFDLFVKLSDELKTRRAYRPPELPPEPRAAVEPSDEQPGLFGN